MLAQNEPLLDYVDDPYDPTFMNPDSVMVDTNSTSATFEQIYTKGDFYLEFIDTVFASFVIPVDSSFHKDAFDSSFTELKAALDSLETHFGNFYLKRPEGQLDSDWV